ncbi:MAG TPA: L,D-transpeptidase [Labilithrix sp.]|nr:L,D-transpeptidase [Labilithrix sp.]
MPIVRIPQLPSPVALLLVAVTAASAVACRRDADPSASLAAAGAEARAGGEAKESTAKVGEGSSPPGDLPVLPRLDGLPPVSLDGSSRPWPPPVPESVPRIAALAIETPVLSQPDVSSPRLGQLRAGAIVEMDPKPVTGKGCQSGFRAIKPLGYVCLGTTTLDVAHPIVRASTRRPDHTQKLPYLYGMAVRGGPAYPSLPSAEVQKALEPNLTTHLKRWAKDPVSGATYGNDLWTKWKAEPPVPALVAMEERRTDPDIPWYLNGGSRLPNLSGRVDGPKAGEFARHNGISFVDSMLFEGRRFNVSLDLRVMPADRFRPIRGSDFHGFRIPEEAKPPFAIVKSKKARRVHEEGSRLVPGESLPWRSVVAITGKQRVQKGRYYEEIEGGSWVASDEVSRVDIAKKMPGWANDGEKWIDINVTRQTLIAYEGTNPVYATLVSTGEAGLDDPATTKATKRGVFRIHTKYITATMDSKTVGEEFELRDVPYVQYFTEGYALHAAYWHDVFGQPKSHGCINLAPEDARRLFFWTGPHVPAGWHGASAGNSGKTGTVVFVHP